MAFLLVVDIPACTDEMIVLFEVFEICVIVDFLRGETVSEEESLERRSL
jgi:hypothetical protein